MDYTALSITSNMEIQEVLQNITKELDDSNITKQRRRYLESYQEDLETYLNNHPEETTLPSTFELFCDLNPQAPECLKYDV